MEIKNERKNQKLKLFYGKDFLNQLFAMNNGSSGLGINPEQIPQSKEQIQLEEDAAKPLRIERGEEKALQYVLLNNYFDDIQTQILEDISVLNLGAVRIETDPIEGIKLARVKPENFLHGKKNDRFFSDSSYFAEVRDIDLGTFKNIAKESSISFTDEEIRQLTGLSNFDDLNSKVEIRVLYYTFKTFFTTVYKKKTNRNTGKINLIDRTKDIGTDKEYSPKYDSDKSEKLTDNYDVWFEGIMCLNTLESGSYGERQIIRHRPVSNMPEFCGKILPPYAAVSPRNRSVVDEVMVMIDSIQELRYGILHHRNTLRGNITEIDPDSIADITLGKEKLTPQEVLSFYFSLNLAFRKTKDEDGDPINGARPLSEIPTGIPYALRELMTQFVSDVQIFNQYFGAVQYDSAKPDPKTQDSS